MTDRRLDAEVAQVLVQATSPQRRLDAEVAQVLVQATSPQRRLDGEVAQVLVQGSSIQRRLDAIVVQVLVPVVAASPVPVGIVAVGADTTPVSILHEDGVWRTLRVQPLN